MCTHERQSLVLFVDEICFGSERDSRVLLWLDSDDRHRSNFERGSMAVVESWYEQASASMAASDFDRVTGQKYGNEILRLIVEFIAPDSLPM